LRRRIRSLITVLIVVLGMFAAVDIVFDVPENVVATKPGWMDEVRLTNSSGDSNNPDMAVWGSNVHVVWRDNRDGHYEVYYKRSIDNGLNWSNDTRLTFTSYDNHDPHIAVYQNNIHIVWYNFDIGIIYYINSTDNGDNWGAITAWDWTSYPPCYMDDPLLCPDVTVSGSNVYIVAYTPGPEDIIFKRSTDNGGSWTNWILVSDFGWFWSTPTIETDGSLIHVVYDDTITSSESLYHYFSDDQGDTWWDDVWNPFVDLDDATDGIMSFTTSMEGTTLRVAYSTWNGTFYAIIILTVYWDDLSELWYGPFEVGINTESDVDVDSNHIVWNEKDVNNDIQVFSNKYGQVTDYPSNSLRPTIAISGNVVHIVWVDNRDGNNELYYTQRGLFPDLVITNSDIQFDPPSPVEKGAMIFINVTVFSYGKSTSNIEVKFYNGNPDVNGDLIPETSAEMIDNDTVDINEDASAVASINWTPPTEGTYDIYVWADPENLEQEYNDTNNLAFKTIEISPSPPLSPTKLIARLSPGVPSDVELIWNASPDDGTGDDDVIGYTIYKSSTGVYGSYEFIAWIPANNSLTYNWTEIAAGDENWTDYFYIIRANDTYGNEEQNCNKVGKVVNYLSEWWNLISIPLIQVNTSRETAFQTIGSNYSSVFGYHAGKSRPWVNWHRDKPNEFNDIIEINHEEGYYIDMINSDHLVIVGKVPTNIQIQLKAGWNLVGYPSLTERTRDNALSSISGLYTKVVFYNTIMGKEEILSPDDFMYPGYGYWIHATADCIWEVES
jgi:hypothetical protein